MANVIEPPLRVGLCGASRRVEFLIESMLASSLFRPVLACVEADAERRGIVETFGVRVVPSSAELAVAPDIDVAWFATVSDTALTNVKSGLSHGKHVILSGLPTSAMTLWDETLTLAREHGAHLLFHNPLRTDEDFRKALAVVRGGTCGAMRTAKWISWSYGVWPAGIAAEAEPLRGLNASPQSAAWSRAVEALDQLLVLWPETPLRVFAVTDSSCTALQLQYANGRRAEIEVQRASAGPLETGWLLQAERGGYVQGRQYSLTLDGEVFDLSVVPADDDAGLLSGLARRVRSRERHVAEEARLRIILQILDAAQRSVTTTQFVELAFDSRKPAACGDVCATRIGDDHVR